MKKSTKISEVEVQNYIFSQKPSYKVIWIINLILFAGVVFLGIEQAGKGAEISKLENKLETTMVNRRDVAENIFKLDDESNFNNVASESGYVKPTTIVYLDSIDTAIGLK